MPIDPACHAACIASWAYMITQARKQAIAWPPLFQSPAWQEGMRTLDAAMLTGDLEGTQAACRALWPLLSTVKVPTEADDPAEGIQR